MAHAVRRLSRLSHRLLWWTPLGLDPNYRPVTRAMAAIQRRPRRPRRRARPPLPSRAGATALNYVDAHHHIWPAQGLPWLDGPMIPRIFGPYEPLQGKAYTAEEYQADAQRQGLQPVRLRAGQLAPRGLRQRSRVGARAARADGLAARDRRLGGPLRRGRDRDATRPSSTLSPLLRGTRLQLHWHEHEAFRFASGPDRASDRTFNENLAMLPGLGLVFELQVFPNQLESAPALVAAHPDLTFVLIHAGMPIAGEPWRDALTAARPPPERLRQALRPGHVRPPRRPRADRAT